jgi:hypothetical protein
VRFVGDGNPALLGDGSWDMVLLVEYPNRKAFLEMVGSEAYLAIAHLRSEALSPRRAAPARRGRVAGGLAPAPLTRTRALADRRTGLQ